MQNEGLISVGLDTITESHQFTGLVTWPWPSATFHLEDLASFKCAFFFVVCFFLNQLFSHNLSHVAFSFWLNEYYYDILSGVCH